jgi:hypothetical protein
MQGRPARWLQNHYNPPKYAQKRRSLIDTACLPP